MRVVIIQNAKHEHAGFIEDLLESYGVNYEYIHAYELNEIPRFEASHIIILGGPMGVYEHKEYPFLLDEIKIIREAYKKEKPLLGICLGAQLIAYAFGGEVYPYKREVGWSSVFKAEDDLFNKGIEKMEVFQFHNDTFTIPEKAKLIFRGNEVENQGIRIGNCIGLQFHVEMTEELIYDWMKYVEDEEREEIIKKMDVLDELNTSCKIIMERFLSM